MTTEVKGQLEVFTCIMYGIYRKPHEFGRYVNVVRNKLHKQGYGGRV